MHQAQAVIKEQNGQYYIYSHKGKKIGGPYDSKDAAEKRLREIEHFKNKGNIMFDDFIEDFTKAAKLSKDPAPGDEDFSLQQNKKKAKKLPSDPAGGRTKTDLVGVVAGVKSSLVIDKKEHLPINTEDQATSAALRVTWMNDPPAWFSGTAKELKSMVLNAIAFKYPDLRVTMKLPVRKAFTIGTTIEDPAKDLQTKVPEFERPNIKNTGPELLDKVYAMYPDQKVLGATLLEALKCKQTELKTAVKVAERLMESGMTGDEFKELYLYLQEDVLRELLYKGTQANKKQEIFKKVIENRKNASSGN